MAKLYRIPPLRHVLDFLALVNVVNQFRSVIDQTHRPFTRNAGTTQTINVGNAQAVETQMRLFDLDKELLPPPRRLKRKFNGEFLFRLPDALKQRTQRGRHRHGESPIFAAFGRGERDFVLRKINAVERQPRFPQPATGVQGNIKCSLHPFRLDLQCFPNDSDFSVRQFRLLSRNYAVEP